MSTPFAPSGWVGFQGKDPDEPQYWDVGVHRAWLGTPGNMIELPSIGGDGYAGPPTLGEVAHGLMGGGLAVTTLDAETRQWTLSWPHLAGRDYQLLRAFYLGLMGDGDLCYLPPEDINRLTLAQSLCGALNGVAEGWTVNGGSIAYDPTQTPEQLPCGVLRWTAPGASGNLAYIGYDPATGVDVDHAVPYVPAEPFTVSVWAATAYGTGSARAHLIAIGADGISVAGYTTGTVEALSTTPGLLSVTAQPLELGTGVTWVVAAVETMTAAGPDMLLSNPQLEMRDAPSDWGLGADAPRVLSTVSPGGTIGAHMTRDGWTMTLGQSVPGAA